MANRAKRHIHKYYRAPYNGNKVWACARPDCTHYMPTHMEHFVNGKMGICWTCEEEMILSPGNMKMDKPLCESCRLGTKDIEAPLTGKLAELLREK